MENLVLRPYEPKDLPELERIWGKYHHKERIELQETGKGVYLLAFLNNELVGRLSIYWESYPIEEVIERIGNFPNIGAFGVRLDKQRQGIGTEMMKFAEKLARDKGFKQVGIAVATDNPDAKRLYERLGFVDWGKGTFEDKWIETNEDGNEFIDSLMCTYLIKTF